MPRIHYKPEQVDQALAVVFELGSHRAAAKATGIAPNTLRDWTSRKHAERYEEISANLRANVDQRLVDRFTANAQQAAEVTTLATEKTRELLESDDVKGASYASSAGRNLATIFGIAVDKSRVIEGKPTVITQHDGRDLDDILRSLNQLVPGLVVDSTCEPITDETLLPQLPPAA